MKTDQEELHIDKILIQCTKNVKNKILADGEFLIIFIDQNVFKGTIYLTFLKIRVEY